MHPRTRLAVHGETPLLEAWWPGVARATATDRTLQVHTVAALEPLAKPHYAPCG